MKKLNWMVTLAAAAFMSVSAHAAPERVGDFTLYDHRGDANTLSRLGFYDAVVFISQKNGCSINEENIARYKVIRTNWDHKNVGFFMINAMDHRDDVREYNDLWGFDIPIMLDYPQLVTQDLGFTHAGQIAIVDPSRMNVLFRGNVDGPERGPLQNVLEQIVDEGMDTRDMETVVEELPEEMAGCELDFPMAEKYANQAPDYETEVAPILIERCVGCHIEGGIGPFAMNSHQMVQGWSPMIRETVMTRRMPPMQVDPDIREWHNAGNLPVEETQTLIHWIEAGAPR